MNHHRYPNNPPPEYSRKAITRTRFVVLSVTLADFEVLVKVLSLKRVVSVVGGPPTVRDQSPTRGSNPQPLNTHIPMG